jgi:hypothetical protein
MQLHTNKDIFKILLYRQILKNMFLFSHQISFGCTVAWAETNEIAIEVCFKT